MPRLPAAERKAALVDAAIVVFAAEGYQASTMDAVAAEAGVTKPVLYQHFPSKHELFLHLLSDVADRMRSVVVEAVSAAATPYEQVQFGFRAYFDFVSSHPDQFRLLFGEGVRIDDTFSREVHQLEHEIAAVIAGLITIDGASPLARMTLAHGIVGLAEATGRYWALGADGLDLDTMTVLVTELAWRGLRGRREGVID
jgi:AcrR family transcriptional regulator